MSSRSTSPTKRSTTTAASPTKRLPGTPTSRRTATPSSDSLNPSLPRLPSLPNLANKKSLGKLSTGSVRAPVRTTPVRIRDQATITKQSSTSSVSLPHPSRRTKTPRSSEEPETSFSLADSDESEEEGRAVAVQKSGFGVRRNLDRYLTTDDEGGFATARETSIGSVVEHESDEEDEEDEDGADGETQNVVVCLRVRPIKTESTDPSIYKLNARDGILAFEAHHPIAVKRMGMGKSSANKHEFHFDALHTAPSPTRELYQSKIKPVVRAAMNGFNGTVFAYGQTASGKTHTMMGTASEPGIIPLAIAELFAFIVQQDSKRSFSLRVSFLEVYNEVLQDLLSSGKSQSRKLEVTGSEGQVKGLEERPVTLPSEVLDLLREGQERRTTGRTDYNAQSSRSHCVFVVTIESVAPDGMARTSRLNLIDLAGSESATSQTDRKAEGANINRSLLTLTKVIGKLSEPNRPTNQHIPFRDSLLTRLLQPALSGKSRVAIICTISPDVENCSESHNTLKFAGDAKKIVTKAERGVLVTDQMMLRQYATQVEQLQAQITAVEGGELIKEAMAKVDELQNRSRKAEDELISKDLELERLKSELERTKSFILTKPVLEANHRRTSGSLPPLDMPLWMTPSRGKRIASEMSGLGHGSPSARSILLRTTSTTLNGSPMTGTVAKELALEKELQDAQSKLGALGIKDDEITTLLARIEALDAALLLAQASVAASESSKGEMKSVLESQREDISAQLDAVTVVCESGKRELEGRAVELASAREEVESWKRTTANATTNTDATIEALKLELVASKDTIATLSTKDATLVESIKEMESKLASHAAELASKDAALLEKAAALREKDAALLAQQASSSSKDVELVASIKEMEARLAAQAAELASKDASLLSKDADLVAQVASLSSKDVDQLASIKEMESQLATRTAELATKDAALLAVESSLSSKDAELVSSIREMESQLSARTAEFLIKDAALLAHEATLATSAASLASKDIKLVAAEAQLAEMVAKSLLPDPRDDTIVSLQHDVATHLDQLAALTESSASTAKVAQDALDTRTTERDEALRLVEELRLRIDELEKELADEQASHKVELDASRKDHDASLARAQEEVTSRDVLLASARSEIATLSTQSTTQVSKIIELQRAVDTYIRKEKEQLQYKVDSEAGTQSLKSKLAALGSRSTTPTNGSSTTRTRSGALRLSTEKVEPVVVDYQLQNTQLMAKVLELEQRALEGFALREKKERAAESQADEWRSKLAESQKLVRQLSTPVPSGKTTPPPRQTLAELNLPVEASKPPLRHGSNGPSPSKARSFPAIHGPSSSYTPGVPPPLPYSPKNIEAQRKLRRETLNRDLALLQGVKGVQKTIETMQSPPPSPRKVCDEFGGLPNGYRPRIGKAGAGSSSPEKVEKWERRTRGATDSSASWE